MAYPARRVSVEGLVRSLGTRSRPEIPWISRVVGCTVGQAKAAVDGIVAQSGTIHELTANIRRTGRSYYAQFPAPLDLYGLVRLVKPRSLVESGVASGVSSAFMLMGAKANSTGTLHSIDFPVSWERKRGFESWAIPSGLSSGWAVPPGLKGNWDLRNGKSEDLLEPLLDEIGTLDFFCHDSPVDLKHFEFEMDAVGKHLKPGSLVVADNTYRRAFDAAAKSLGARALYRRGSSLGAFRVPPEN
jgi:Methyltransferase domain